MSILSELKKLTGKQSAKVVSEALPDSFGGGGSPLILEFATEDPYTVDTPISDIQAAIEAGRQVWFRDGTGVNIIMTRFSFDNGSLVNMEFTKFKNFEIKSVIIYDALAGWGVLGRK